MTNHSALAKAENEAIEWAILLADDPDSVDHRMHFEAWIEADSVHAEAWARTLQVYDVLGQLTPTSQDQWPQGAASSQRKSDISRQQPEGIRGTARSFLEWIRTRSTVHLFSSWRRASAGLTLVLGCMLVFFPYINLRVSADYFSGTGEQKVHVLEDGSKLYLAPKSAVDVAYSAGERQVRLLKGSAFFEVHPNANRPFQVDAGGTKTTVLGTSFSVQKSDSEVSISVVHGKVRVEDLSLSPAVTQNLTAGDQLLIARGKGASLFHVSPDDVASWRKGELLVRNLPVGEVAKAFHDYYEGVILVTEPFASQRVTGLYRLDKPVATLTEMALAHGVKARQITPWLLVLGD
ncbi:MAG TPA: FecR domain-containing protein [Cellvibrio sp.]|nr:FecR domain-containing protein [Cellvibrio sp.]